MSMKLSINPNIAEIPLAGPFKRGVLSHAHAPTHVEKHLEV